jgi:hypothetical protein
LYFVTQCALSEYTLRYTLAGFAGAYVALNQTVLQVYLSTVDMALDIGYVLVLAV